VSSHRGEEEAENREAVDVEMNRTYARSVLCDLFSSVFFCFAKRRVSDA
jgi:hypothetical protein